MRRSAASGLCGYPTNFREKEKMLMEVRKEKLKSTKEMSLTIANRARKEFEA